MKKNNEKINPLELEMLLNSFFEESLSVEEDTYTKNDLNILHARDFNQEVSVGDIRLLSQTESISYVAVVKQLNESEFLVFPYSHYSTPIDDYSEMQSENQGLYLMVYQIWNRMFAQKSVLSNTWKVGIISKCEQDKLLKFAMEYENRNPQTLNPLKKRYMAKELQRLSPFINANEKEADFTRRCLFFKSLTQNMSFINPDEKGFIQCAATDVIPPTIGFFNGALAAGPIKSNYTKDYILKNKDILSVEYSYSEHILRFKVYDPRGYISNSMDGIKISLDGVSSVGFINDGKIILKNITNFNGIFVLLDENNNFISLESD